MKKTLTVYQIQHILYNTTFPKIIIKILGLKKRIVLLCKNKDDVDVLDNLLWTFSQLSFIPHATENDDFNLDLQDIIITTKLDNKSVIDNRSLVIVSTELIKNEYVNYTNEVFLITTENIDLQAFKENALDTITNKRIIKYFTQRLDNSWKIN